MTEKSVSNGFPSRLNFKFRTDQDRLEFSLTVTTSSTQETFNLLQTSEPFAALPCSIYCNLLQPQYHLDHQSS
jgi:hypothetical protein